MFGFFLDGKSQILTRTDNNMKSFILMRISFEMKDVWTSADWQQLLLTIKSC